MYRGIAPSDDVQNTESQKIQNLATAAGFFGNLET
jgi:hypothetical protein